MKRKLLRWSGLFIVTYCVIRGVWEQSPQGTNFVFTGIFLGFSFIVADQFLDGKDGK